MHRKKMRAQISQFLSYFSSRAVNYREALAWLYGTQRFGIKLGLENIQRLFVALRSWSALRDRSSGRPR